MRSPMLTRAVGTFALLLSLGGAQHQPRPLVSSSARQLGLIELSSNRSLDQTSRRADGLTNRRADEQTEPRTANSEQRIAWRQWGGPNRNFIVDATGIADKWPADGPRVIWSRPLGTGHSAIVADGGRLFTMYRAGNGRARQGPWQADETVIALDAATGRTIWEQAHPSALQDFSYGAGPHSTPLIVGDRLFTFGTNQKLFTLLTGHGR